MAQINRQVTAPRRIPRSRRNIPVSHLSTLKPGVVHPIAFARLHREDILTGALHAAVEMMETKELISNGVAARFTAWVVPDLAMKRFQGSRDQFDRSFMGKPKTDDPGETVTQFFQTQVYGDIASMPIFKAAGKHYGPADPINTNYVESYNAIINWQLLNRSKELTQRLLTDTSLAPAFWRHGWAEHIVADFDQAQLQGEVALNIVEQRTPIRGLMMGTRGEPAAQTGINTEGAGETYPLGWAVRGENSAVGPGTGHLIVQSTPLSAGAYLPNVFAELQQNGITVSLANLKKAKMLQGFAEIRKHFEGHDDDKIIDMMLMAGLTVEDQWLKDPILLDEEIVYFRQGKRYSSTAGQLDDSAVSGVLDADLYLRCPRLAVGGTVVVMVEVLPDQLWERRPDPFMYVDGVDDLPDALLDQLDTEKVDVVTNRMVDVAHASPNDTFGYEPMNARWTTGAATIGGDFLKPAASTGNTEARKRLWSIEETNPVLGETFHIAKNGVHRKVFLDEVLDPFQIQCQGNLVADGLTQFGGLLVEATGNYDKLDALTGDDKIEKD